jgi:hypothetical protein
MDLLFILTVVSLVAAVGFGALTVKLLRDEKARSEARVAALANAMDGESSFATASADKPARPVLPRETRSSRDLFAPASAAAVRGNPLVKALAGAALALMVIAAIYIATGGGPGGDGTRVERAASPLELVSMRHAREGQTLTVTGLVRNPPTGANVTRITAVVFAFDRTGAFVASGGAPLDFTTLEPGDESPFVVTIPNVTDVGRYRVTFRGADGVVRHVDRRDPHTAVRTPQSGTRIADRGMRIAVHPR